MGSIRRSCRLADNIYPNWSSVANGEIEVEEFRKAQKTRSVRSCKASSKTSDMAGLLDIAESDKEVEKNKVSDKDENQVLPLRKRKVRTDVASSRKSRGQQGHLMIQEEYDFKEHELQPVEVRVVEENTRHLEIVEKRTTSGNDISEEREVILFKTPVVTATAAQTSSIRIERPFQGIKLAVGTPLPSSERAKADLSLSSCLLSDHLNEFELILGCSLDKKDVSVLRRIHAAHPETFKGVDLEGDRLRRGIFHVFAEFIVEYEHARIDDLDLGRISVILKDIVDFEKRGFNLGWASTRVESVKSIKSATSDLDSFKVAKQELSLRRKKIEAMKKKLELLKNENAKEIVTLEENEARVLASLPEDVHGDDFFWKGLF